MAYMKKALISRYGAYGDIIHMSHLPRLLKDQGFDIVDVETNQKGYQLLYGNPFIDTLTGINPEVIFKEREWLLTKHWQLISQGYDKFINLYGSLEYGLLSMENDPSYYMSSNVRRERYSGINYYDQTTVDAGYKELIGKYRGEVFFSDAEHTIVKDWLKKFDGEFTVLVNLSGTGPHKRFVQAAEFIHRILDTYSNVRVITTGSAGCVKWDLKHPRVTSIVGKFPFRQALLISKYVNLVIGCESGLLCGAAMFETPTIMLMTAADIDSHNRYNRNDLSLQSECYCSPCHKGPYKYYGCPHKDGNPLCVYFDLNKIMEQFDRAYSARTVTA